jgi:hypothetical protein
LFWPVYLLLMLCGLETSLVSDSADMLLYFYIGVTFWLIWIWQAQGVAGQARWAMLLPGATAMNVKLSGILFLPVIFVLTPWLAGPSVRALVAQGAFCLLLVAPMLVIQGITSGHPLFPGLTLALPVDWAAAKELLAAIRTRVYDYPVLGEDPPQPLTTWPYIRTVLIGNDQPYMLGVLAALAVSALAAWRERGRSLPVLFAAVLAAIGLAQLDQQPDFRFSFGYLILLPTLMLAGRQSWFVGVYAATLALLYLHGFETNRLDKLRLALYLGVVLAFGWASLAKFRLPAQALIGCLVLGQLMRPLATAAKGVPELLHDPSWVLQPSPPIVSCRRGKLGEFWRCGLQAAGGWVRFLGGSSALYAYRISHHRVPDTSPGLPVRRRPAGLRLSPQSRHIYFSTAFLKRISSRRNPRRLR